MSSTTFGKYQNLPAWLPREAGSARKSKLFNLGLLFAWSYNQGEALRSFEAGVTQSNLAEAALMHWGRAYALGPFANRIPHDEDPGYPAFLPSHFEMASEAAQQAAKLALREREAASSRKLFAGEDLKWVVQLTQANLHRFHPSILSPDNSGFAVRFNAASAQYAAVLEGMGREAGSAALLAMAAETLLMPEAWAYTQDANGHPSLDATGQHAAALIDESLRIDPDQPLALHLHIHLTEAGSPVKRQGNLSAIDAVQSAWKLHAATEDQPWRHMGHLMHMPSHTFIHAGLYNEAVEANLQSLHQDAADFADCQVQPSSAHTADTLIYAANMAGRSKLALDLARRKQEQLDGDVARLPGNGWLVFHGQWREILAELRPPPLNARGICEEQGYQYAVVIYHFAMAVAHAANAETLRYHQEDESTAVQGAQLHMSELQAAAAAITPGRRTLPGQGEGLYGCEYKLLTDIQVQVASARLAQATGSYPGNFTAAEMHMRQAVELEGQLSYAMPPRQYQPLRHCLAHILMRAHKPQQAEQAAREVLELHPDNPWGLYALLESLLKQNGTSTESGEVHARLKHAWRGADEPITCPCPIFVIW
ncbi:hypothetical protein WJX73_009381 [Symbiochloris irregularis]|uniref:Tetratricopeptide repeat protein n=1 Tax=Symbiochloris irregularis TaxID=706552 RepID=A0AAW1NT22_9CHLO